MGVLLFLFGTALAAGLYFVLADLLKIPRLATERALISGGSGAWSKLWRR